MTGDDISGNRRGRLPTSGRGSTQDARGRYTGVRPMRLVVSVAFAALLVPLGVLATQKSREIMRLNSMDLMQFEDALEFWRSGTAPTYLPVRDAKTLLSSCLQLTGDWKFLLQPVAVQGDVLGHCADAAGAVGPGMSEASTLYARAALQAGDAQSAARHLDTAWRGAPSDLWLALSRIDIALAVVGDLGARGDLSSLARELELLGRTHRGVDTAVWLYVKYPELRGELKTVAEDWDPEIRLRFLRRLKSRIGEMKRAS